MSQKSSQPKPSTRFSVQSLDILGEKFKIGFWTLTGRTQTKLGGYLTILMSLISLSIFVVITSQYFLKNTPVVMTASEFGSKVASFKLYDEDLYILFTIAIGTNYLSEAQMKRFLTVKAQVVEAAFLPEELRFDIKPYREFDYVTCNNTKDPKILKMVRQIVPVSGFEEFTICPDFRGQEQDFVVYDNYENYTHRWSSIKFYPCSLPEPSQCASAEELKNLRVDTGFPFKLLETSDSENPLRSSPFRRSVRVDRRSRKALKEIVKLNKVLDYSYSMIPPTLRVEFATLEEDLIDSSERDSTQLHCTQEQLKLPLGTPGACEEYLSFDYEAMGEVLVTRRSYKNLMTMMGEFGGILKVLTTGTFFIYGLYHMRKIKSLLGDIIFKRDKKSTKRLSQLLEKKSSPNNTTSKKGEVAKTVLSSNIHGRAPNKKLEETKVPNLKEVIQELVKTRSNVEDLMGKLNLLELIEKAIFKDHERQLLPLVLLKVKQREMMEENPDKKSRNHHSKNAIFRKKSPEDSRHQNPFESAFDTLVNSAPDDDFSKKIKDFILGELNGVFPKKVNIQLQNKQLKLMPSVHLKVKNNYHFQNIGEDEKGRIEASEKNEAQSSILGSESKNLKKISSIGYIRPTNSPIRLRSRLGSKTITNGQKSPFTKIGMKPQSSQNLD